MCDQECLVFWSVCLVFTLLHFRAFIESAMEAIVDEGKVMSQALTVLRKSGVVRNFSTLSIFFP